MPSQDKNKASRRDRLGRIASGVLVHYGNVPSIVLAGQERKPQDVADMIQKDIETTLAADKGRAAWRVLVQAERESHRALAPVLRALRSRVAGDVGDGPEAAGTLADFGYKPRKVAKLDSAAKAAAAEKGRKTRSERSKRHRTRADGDGAPATLPPVET